MWLDKKEWLVVFFCTLLIAPGVTYYFFNPHYVENIIYNPGLADTVRVIPGTTDNKKLVVKLTGTSSTNYALKLNLFYKKKNLQFPTTVHSETIKIPAGTFNGNFTKNFNSELIAEKAEIIFIPETKPAKGRVKIETRIF